jgi:hypothetical protein
LLLSMAFFSLSRAFNAFRSLFRKRGNQHPPCEVVSVSSFPVFPMSPTTCLTNVHLLWSILERFH